MMEAQQRGSPRPAVVNSFPAWRDAVQDLFPGFDPRDGGLPNFRGEFQRRSIGELRITALDASRSSIVHERLDHRAAHRPGCCLILQLNGEAGIAQAQERVKLRPGDLTLVDGTRPVRFEFDRGYRLIAVQLPHEALSRRFAGSLPAARLLARGLPVPGMLGAMVQSLFAGAGALRPAQGTALGAMLIELLALACEIGEARGRPGVSQRAHGDARLLLADDFIERHLDDPELAPHQVARGAGLSVRQLHRLLSKTGTSLGELIIERRLERCRRDLARMDTAGSIGAVALAHGFSSFSHFSRSFKSRYGTTPREYRRAAARNG